MRNKILTIGLILGIVFSFVVVGSAYIGDAPKVVVEGNYIEAPAQLGETMLGISTADNFTAADITATGNLSVTGTASVGELTQGGGILALATSTGTTVLTEAQLLAYNIIDLTVNTGTTATLTLPATSTMTTLLPNAGDMREWVINNATSSTMALTIGAGTGIDLMAYTTNDDVIDETEVAELKCWRQTDTDVTCITTEILHAD